MARRGDLIKAMMLENPITEEDQLEVNAKVHDQFDKDVPKILNFLLKK